MHVFFENTFLTPQQPAQKIFVFWGFLFFKNLVLPAERRGFLKNTPKKNNKKNTIFKVKKWSNYVAQHNWTTF